MMPLRPLTRLVRQNLRRNLRHFVASGVGILLGIAAFVFILGLSGGATKVFLGDMFPIDRVEVIAPKTSLVGGRIVLDEGLVAQVRARPEVEKAYPKMKMLFPAKGWGNLLGNDLRFEVGGFCDGIEPVLVEGDPGTELFKDWEELEKGQLTDCTPEPANACPDPMMQYCGWDRKCHHRVPVLLSRTLIEIYNASFAPAHGMPRIGAAHAAALQNRMRKLSFKIGLGESFIQGSTENLRATPEQVEAQLIGISDKAMTIGMTVPIGYIRRWNARYVGEQAAREFSSIVVDVRDKDEVASFVSWVKKAGYETEESLAERIALAIFAVTLLFLVISFVIIGLSAVNISHTFFMLITDRRREIGILRAVGASRLDVKKIILAEAAVIGAVAGSIGVLLGVGAALLVNFLSATLLPDFPFKPTSWFAFTPGLLVGALGFAIVFCLLGAYFPARKAATMQPAQALAA
jgi:hypothetical protein